MLRTSTSASAQPSATGKAVAAAPEAGRTLDAMTPKSSAQTSARQSEPHNAERNASRSGGAQPHSQSQQCGCCSGASSAAAAAEAAEAGEAAARCSRSPSLTDSSGSCMEDGIYNRLRDKGPSVRHHTFERGSLYVRRRACVGRTISGNRS